MASEWPVVRIEDIAEKIAMGPFGSSIKVATFVDGGIPIISGAHLNGFRVADGHFNFITVEHAGKLKNANVRRGDVIFTHAGNIGQVAYIPSNSKYERYVISQRQFYLRCDRSKADPAFITYFFHGSAGRHQLLANKSQVGVPSISRPTSNLKTIEVSLPSLSEQRKIARFLDLLDDRIDNLRATNATLEAIAQSLFKSWFVDFDPVHAKAEGRAPEGMDAATAALFPSEFDDSELGPVPKGWRSFAFGEIAQLHKGTVNPGAGPAETFQHYSLPAFDAGQLPLAEQGSSIKSNKTPVPSGAVLVSKLNPHIPRIWFVRDAGNNAICSTEFLVWTPKKGISEAMVYCAATSTQFNAAMRQLVTGTSNSHQRVRPAALASVHAAVADPKAIKAFGEIAASLLTRVEHNRRQAGTLANVRDTLLPRLISGKLRLPGAMDATEATPA